MILLEKKLLSFYLLRVWLIYFQISFDVLPFNYNILPIYTFKITWFPSCTGGAYFITYLTDIFYLVHGLPVCVILLHFNFFLPYYWNESWLCVFSARFVFWKKCRSACTGDWSLPSGLLQCDLWCCLWIPPFHTLCKHKLFCYCGWVAVSHLFPS